MNRRELLFVSGALLVAPLARAQPAGKVYRVGMAWIANAATVRPYQEAFLQGLREQGFEQGRNLVFDVRNCDGDQSRLPPAVEELLALKPDLLAGIEQTAHVMQAKTTTVPIVMTYGNDPVAAGLVKSLSRPGGNVTGVAVLTEAMAAKQLELLAEILPQARSFGLMLDPGVPATESIERHARDAARSKGASVVAHYARDRAGLERAIAELERKRPDAVVLSAGSGMYFGNRRFIGESLQRMRLPASAGVAEYADAGVLLTYGASIRAMHRRAAFHAARILRGARPGELPVEQATVFEVVINLRTARALGIKIPPQVLLRADRVIE